MFGLRARLHQISGWATTNRKRRNTVRITIIVVATLASVIPTINSYTIDSFTGPAGLSAWFATSALGAHEVTPQYSQACVTHDRYYPPGMPVDQSGWPLSFEYDIFTPDYNCQGIFYPVLFLVDCFIFAAAYIIVVLMVPWLITKLRRNKHITRIRLLLVGTACVISVFVTYETSNIVYIVGPAARPLPVLSTIVKGTYELPASFPLCPSANKTVNDEICNASGLCALTGISEPSDPRQAVQGWPLAYIYNSLDPCFWEAVYPLVFVADSLVYTVAIVGASLGIKRMWMQRTPAGIH